ncbi:MAG TPA: FAD-binding oxidoreductase [Acidimicrobiia bacterium]|nr:FAD-binding oxidoreductase [Acidimicrobiia bacterium]
MRPDAVSDAVVEALVDRFPDAVVKTGGRTDRVLLAPASTEQACEMIRYVMSARIPTSFVGNGAGGDLPLPPSRCLISTRRLTGVVDHKPDDLTATLRTGTTLGDLEATLHESAQSAVLPETTPSRTVGGVVASGSSGYRRLRYGPTRDRVIGVTLVTGYGEVVRGGGQLVKNVTGYDLARLVTGSHGALGLITEVSVKLWPTPRATATIPSDDPAAVLSGLHRPSAILETQEGSLVYVEGAPASITHAEQIVGNRSTDGLHWPEPLSEGVVVSVRVPARSTSRAVSAVGSWKAERFIAQHGVGIVDVGFTKADAGDIDEMRAQIRSIGGIVVIERWRVADMPSPDPMPDRWGAVPSAMDIETRLRSLFDPHGILSEGMLPGGTT